MILIDDVLVSDEILQEEFVCNLKKCKGGCCVDGDAGAPLTETELSALEQVFPMIQQDLSAEALKEINRVGIYTTDPDFGYVTPAINGGICVYGYTDELGIVKCLLEKYYREGKTNFQKPISCHLYPIREVKNPHHTTLNYEPRAQLCAPACQQGKKLGVKVYEFLKEPLIRKFGEPFYIALQQIDQQYVNGKNKS